MDLWIVLACIVFVITLYFINNPMAHSGAFIFRRFVNWFPLGMTYAFLYMARYNLNVTKNALGSDMSKENFGLIFGAGTVVYGLSFLVNGPLVDRIGGKKGIVISALGASLANIAMGVVTYLFMMKRLQLNMTLTFAILYSINMYFQSYGAVSIIKVKAYWFHVRERGIFGAIFGTLISFGVYFAFDWGQAIADAAKVHAAPGTLQKIIGAVFATDTFNVDSIWLVFFIPALILIFWAVADVILIKDSPSLAGFEDFDTHDASSGKMDEEYSFSDLLKKVFTSRIMLILAAIEFTAGVLRNGIMQWYFIFAKEVPQIGAEFFQHNWGILLCLCGIVGGFSGGILSDNVFGSRRGPPVGLFNALMLFCASVMTALLFVSPVAVGVCCLVISCAVIGVHSLTSGTAAADFGGRKATATCMGIVDGFVYLGTGFQSICLGFLTTKSWLFWPAFLIPFALIGLILALRIWTDLPEATRKYLAAKNAHKIPSGASAVHFTRANSPPSPQL